MSDTSLTLTIGTDVAHILLFDPADLAHTEGWPLGWYADPPAWQVESAAGRLIAWCTTSDGGFKVRATTGGLTAREAPFARQSWVFPYTVRSGRVLIDNSDSLLGESRMTNPEQEPERWMALAPGDYNVTVTALEWWLEAGSDGEDFDTLPSNVVTFAPRGSAALPAIAQRPPGIVADANTTAGDAVMQYPAQAEADALAQIDFNRTFPAAVCAGVVPGREQFDSVNEAQFGLLADERNDPFALMKFELVIVPQMRAGELGMLCQIRGISDTPDDRASTYSLQPLGPVTISSVGGAWNAPPPLPGSMASPQNSSGLWQVSARPVVVPEVPVADAAPAEYRALIVGGLAPGAALATRVGVAANYHRLMLAASLREAELTGFLLKHLPLETTERLALSILPAPERVRELTARLRQLK